MSVQQDLAHNPEYSSKPRESFGLKQRSFSSSRLDRMTSMERTNPILQSDSRFNVTRESKHYQNNPMKKSHSVSNIIHGEPNLTPLEKTALKIKKQGGHHYIDELDRFRRDHGTINKEEQQAQKEKLLKIQEKKRALQMQRQKEFHEREESNIRKMMSRKQKIYEQNQIGDLRNSFVNSIPVNPITLKYDNTEKARRQQASDNESKLNKLVRTHHLQTMGNSAYNIINGSSVNYTEAQVPKSNQTRFEQKLERYYSQFSVKPQGSY